MLATASLVLYAATVLVVVFWPTPVDRDYRGAIDRVLQVAHRHGLPEWFGYRELEFLGNVALFLPLGFFLALVLPGRLWWLTVLICPAFSVLIELSQGAFLSERFSSPWDVAANTLGGLSGALVAVGIRALVHARDERVIARALWRHRHP